MRMRTVLAALLFVSSIGCFASAPRASVPDLAGAWDFTIDVGATLTPGSMTLVRSVAGYTGELRAAGPNALPVRSVVVTGTQVDLAVATPEGPVTFRGQLSEGANRMVGEVTYHGGRKFPMTAIRRRER